MTARRYNKGKLRYDLPSTDGIKAIVDVYTRGAHKYTLYKDSEGNLIKGADIPLEDVHKYEVVDSGADNWRKGMSWRETMASVKRHIASWEDSEDFDELGTMTIANAAWGLITLLDYYKTHPELDDRNHSYLNHRKIGLDIDEVLADWVGEMMVLFPEMTKRSVYWNDYNLLDNFPQLKENEQFWLNIKPKIDPLSLPFEPHCYITARPISTKITEKWLKINGFPKAPVYTVGSNKSKVDVAKESGIDIFVDDSFKNFVELNKAGICTYLMDAPHNKRYDVGYKRITNLKQLI